MKKIIMTEYLEYNSEFKLGGHHYAELFRENGYKVLWLSPMYNILIYFKNKELYKKRKLLNQKRMNILNGVYLHSPFSLLLYGNYKLFNSHFVNKMSIKFTIPNLINLLKKNNFYDVDILWITNIKYYPLVEKIKYKKLIYRCPDDISEFKTTCRSMNEIEEKLIRKADYVFVTSNNLLEKKKYLRDDLVYLPNGVELGNFIRDNYTLPYEYKGKKRQKCIYVGAIDHWFDLKLVMYCADKLKDIDFYLIGPKKIDIDILTNYDNIYLLGKKDYKEIPNYLYYSDVAIIPFQVNKLTDSITPIKLYEYMSVGLNVVCTNFKEMQYINSPAYVAKSYEEFCTYIRQAIESKDKNMKENITFARNNTWEKRFQEINNYIK